MGRGPSIEGRKNAEDARKGKLFTKLIREITIASRSGADPATNSRLRAGIDKALSANMTRETVDRAVKRGSGADGADNMHELRYEGYGPSGVALIIDCMTDNQQRTVADIRHALSKHGGNLGTTGSVAFQFLQRFEEHAAHDLIMQHPDLREADGRIGNIGEELRQLALRHQFTTTEIRNALARAPAQTLTADALELLQRRGFDTVMFAIRRDGAGEGMI